MASIRMPDGTVIRGVPDGVSIDEINSHLVEQYGQDAFIKMMGPDYEPPTTRTKGMQEYLEPDESEPATADPTAPAAPRTKDKEEFFEGDYPRPREDSLVAASERAHRRSATIQNEDGSVSSIRSISVEDERLNDGKPTLIPSIWEGKQLSAGAAVGRAVDSAIEWPSYDTNEQATAASKRISGNLEGMREESARKRQERDKMTVYTLGREQWMQDERGIATPKRKDQEERIQDLGRAMGRFLEHGATPEDYYMSPEEVEAFMFDRVAYEQQMKKESAEAAAAAGIKPDSATEGEEVEKNRWLHLKDKVKNVWESMFQGQDVKDAAKLAEDARYGAMAKLYLVRAAEEYPSLSEDVKTIIDDAAEKYGLTGAQYYKFTGSMLDSIVDNERATLKGYGEFQKEVNKHRVELGEFGLGYLATMAIDNVNNVVYMAVAMATKSPQVMAALMGTDIYVTTWANARQDGRTMGEASQDAFVSALIEGATEGLPEGLPIIKILKLMKAGNKSAAAKLLSGMGVEGTQELAAEILQMAYEDGIIGDDITVAEAFTRMRDAGILGMMFGAAFAAPAAAFGDNELANSNKRIKDAKTALRLLANKVQAEGDQPGAPPIWRDAQGNEVPAPDDIGDRGDAFKSEFGVLPAESAEAKAVVKEYADALKERRGIVQGRLDAEKEKKKTKTDKKETKRKTKRTPAEVQREAAAAKAKKTDQSVDKLTPEIEVEAEGLAKISAHEEVSEKAEQELIDKGLANRTKSGALVVLPAGARRLKAVKKAQEEAGVYVEDLPLRPR